MTQLQLRIMLGAAQMLPDNLIGCCRHSPAQQYNSQHIKRAARTHRTMILDRCRSRFVPLCVIVRLHREHTAFVLYVVLNPRPRSAHNTPASRGGFVCVALAAQKLVYTPGSDEYALAHTSSLDTDLTRNTHAPHFTPQHRVLCHMGLY